MRLFSRVYRERRRVVVPLLVLLGANVAVLALVIFPLQRRVQAAADAESRTLAQMAGAKREDTEARMAQSRKQEVDVELAKFYKEILPRDLAAAQVSTQLWLATVARNHGVMFQQSTDRHAEVRDSLLFKVTSEATLSGTYRDIRRFLYAVESAPQFVIIEEIQLGDTGTSAQSNAKGELEIAIKASTYFVRAQQ
jgi:Tfp pilus assembly protein PilO